MTFLFRNTSYLPVPNNLKLNWINAYEKKSGMRCLCLDIFSTQKQTYWLCLKILFFAFSQVFCALRNEVKCFELIRKTVISPELRNENKTDEQKSQKL